MKSKEIEVFTTHTQYKKLRRREMLTGKRPVECDYCWGVEDNSDRFSDRVFKSSEKLVINHTLMKL